MRLKSLIVLLIALPAFYGAAQNSISGTITVADGIQPLQDVSIYLPQLEKGAISDSTGKYTITNLPLGSYKIVASFIGFQTFSRTILMKPGANSLDVMMAPSAIEMQEVIVSTPFHKLQRENVMKVEHAKITDLKAKGALTLAEGITNIPGVASVSTGMGIGKPVIRGLSSNRVLVYAQGIRLENQQFGDEHGLGINDAGIESVEVIKGPASLLYGSDAMGGVLYLNPEKFGPNKSAIGDVNLDYFSNTSGFGGNAGVKTSGEHLRFLIRSAWASHADYETGDDLKVTNSRFREFDLKTGLAYQNTIFKTELRYNFSNSLIGIPEEMGAQTNDRTPDLPYQELSNHILSSNTDLFFENSSLKVTLGYIFNDRQEFGLSEEAGQPGLATALLDMNLSTLSYNVQYHLPKGKLLETIVGVQGMRQTNKNFGEEVLIPDALTNDAGILATSHLHFDKSDIQFGLRLDHRKITGESYGNFGDSGYIAALDRAFNSVNAAAGYRVDFLKTFIGRVNLASGFRAPSLAELTSNGVHEGTNRYEIGNGELRNEKNLQTDIALEYNNEHVEFYINGFYNPIKDYIFLQPTGEMVENDPVFRYNQQNAKLYGGEIGLHLHPHPLDWLHLESSFETVRGQLSNKSALPLIPANSLRNSLRIEFKNSKGIINKGYAFATLKSFFRQDRVSDFETPTGSYSLVDLGYGNTIALFRKECAIRITANNILNKRYISHLSRLKADGHHNMGRNISLGLSVGL